MIKVMKRRVLSAIRMIKFRLIYPSIKYEGELDVHKETELLCYEGGQLYLGDKLSTCRGVSLGVVGGKLIIGKRVFFNRNSIVACRHYISIGDGCSFGPNVMIYDHDHLFDNHGYKKSEYSLGSITIDKGCWIGANVIILKDTHIGEGTIIGAGTIVKGYIPPHSLVKSKREMVIETLENREV